MIEKQHRTLELSEGRFSYKAAGKNLGWDRIGFTLGTHHGTGKGGFEYYAHSGPEAFTCTAERAIAGGVEMHGKYGAPGLAGTVRARDFWTDESVTFADGHICERLAPRSAKLYELPLSTVHRQPEHPR